MKHARSGFRSSPYVTPDVIDGDVVQFVESQVQAIIPEIRTLQAAKLGCAS